jgi:oligopeptide/dipeptide ABC transporter ATP-binding protein
MEKERKAILEIEHLHLDYRIGERFCHAVHDVSLTIHSGEILALVGESGCGKTQTALACMGLQPESAHIGKGKIYFEGRELLSQSKQQWNTLRGKGISMIFQEPMTALNPLVKVGKQIEENGRNHGLGKIQARESTLSMMEKVGLPDVGRLYSCYPHQLSGGMRQRIIIAMALINDPPLLIADEPTTALDVTIQKQIMSLMKTLNKELGTAIMLISHDLGVVSHLCDYVHIMYAGTIVENGPVHMILNKPLHPYTKGLLGSIPSYGKKDQRLDSIAGIVPSLENRPQVGCQFYNRCTQRMASCKNISPHATMRDGHMVACHLYPEEA